MSVRRLRAAAAALRSAHAPERAETPSSQAARIHLATIEQGPDHELRIDVVHGTRGAALRLRVWRTAPRGGWFPVYGAGLDLYLRLLPQIVDALADGAEMLLEDEQPRERRRRSRH